MAKTKIQSGYGDGKRGGGKRYHYAGRRTGRKSMNGGFANEVAITYETVSQEDWDRIFPNGFKGPHLKND